MHVRRTTGADHRTANIAAALGTPARVTLLRALQQPRGLAEIKIAVVNPAAADGRAPAMTRQSIRAHLEKLIQAGLVIVSEARHKSSVTVRYVLKHQAIYALSEDFRELARLRPDMEFEEPTMPTAGTNPTDAPSEPGFQVAKGPDEGRFHRLGTEQDDWLIGRRRDADIALDYDPFASAENTRIRREGDQYWAVSLPRSRNGTRLNFAPLDPDSPVKLRNGDLLGVGRTNLVFRFP